MVFRQTGPTRLGSERAVMEGRLLERTGSNPEVTWNEIMLPNYSRVRLLTDRFSPEGIKYGDTGYIIDTHDKDVYEVEFSDSKGITVAQIVAYGHELEICDPLCVKGSIDESEQ